MPEKIVDVFGFILVGGAVAGYGYYLDDITVTLKSEYLQATHPPLPPA